MTVVALVPSAGPVPPPTMVVMPEPSASSSELRADEVHVAVDGAGGEDPAVARQDLGRGPDHQRRVDAVHGVGVAGLADADDATVAHADVGLDDAPVVEDHGAGDDQVGRALGAGGRRLAHRLADDLAAAEHAPRRRRRVRSSVTSIEQVGVGQPDAVTGGRAEQRGVAAAFDLHQSRPVVLVGPDVERSGHLAPQAGDDPPPASATSVTSRSMPGSKRTEVPAGMASRNPRAAARSNASAGFASAKW